MQEPVQDVPRTNVLATLRPHDHPCLIYETPDEQADAFVPYLHAGLVRGEKCFYVVDQTHREFILSAFRQRKVDIDSFVASGAFTVISKDDAYLTEGYFDTTKMIRFWESTVEEALAEGYTAVRAAAEMTWALSGAPGSEELVTYESTLNEIFPKLKVSALCQYHRKRFSPKVIKDMIHIHPILATGGETFNNPTFVNHREFIDSHDEMEVQKLLDTIAMANRLQERTVELDQALRENTAVTDAMRESKRLQSELQQALENEQKTRKYAEAVKTELEEFVNNATEGLHWVGRDGTILWANPAELELLGYSKEEYVGRNIREFHAEQKAISEIFCRLENKETLHNFRAQLRAKDGSIKTVLISSNVLWRDGQFVHTQCFTRDITDLQIAEQRAAHAKEIQELNEELHSLARVVSHELQEPIAKIRSYLGLLAVRYRGQLGKDADEFIDVCTESAKVVHRMIDDLWLFARMTKVEDRDVSVVSVNSIVAGVIDEYRDKIRATKAEIKVGDLPRVRFSEKQLSYLFESFINNALTYRRDDVAPSIQISAELRKKEWVFAVADNGCGIDPMHFRDVFKAFFRVNSRPGDAGTGMGLAICQKILHSNRGRIWAESVPGQGSTFYFSVPANV